ncbi:hypothetical protein [Dorea phocaeensis]|uniref:hypothetical protein n=1 Tax=Dorea phocaeensis TaxID=2040291 RepID=UPI0013564B38|nr:hypothetical protein [Dorea phocaeensis]
MQRNIRYAEKYLICMIFSGKERKSLGTGKCEGWEPDSVKCENQAVRSVKIRQCGA